MPVVGNGMRRAADTSAQQDLVVAELDEADEVSHDEYAASVRGRSGRPSGLRMSNPAFRSQAPKV